MLNDRLKKKKSIAAVATAIAAALIVQAGIGVYDSRHDFNIDIKKALEDDFDDSIVDELIIENHLSKEISDLYTIKDYIELSEKLNKMSVLKKIEVPKEEIDQSTLLKPDQIYNLIEMVDDKDKKDQIREMLKIEEALINEHIYNFAYVEAPNIEEIITKSQIIDSTEMSENENSRLTTTGYESVCLNHDRTKKIAYVTGTATFTAKAKSDLGKYVILSLNLSKQEQNEDKRSYHKETNKEINDYIKYLNRVLINDYETVDRYNGHLKKLVPKGE